MRNYVSQMGELALAGDKQGILFFIALYCFLLLNYSCVYQLRVRAWPRVRGKLLDAHIDRIGGSHLLKSDQDYRATALYTYIVNNEKYCGKRVSPWVMIASHNARLLLHLQLKGVQKHEDGGVDVFYNPKSPGKSFLIKPGLVGLGITFILAVGPFILYWYGYHS